MNLDATTDGSPLIPAELTPMPLDSCQPEPHQDRSVQLEFDFDRGEIRAGALEKGVPVSAIIN